MEESVNKIKAFTASNVRDMVRYINSNLITKDNIVTIVKDNSSQFTLLYY